MPLIKRSVFKPSESKYYTYYNTRIKKTANTTPSKLKTGYVCRLFYTKLDEVKKVGQYGKRIVLTKPLQYIILVLHPNFHGYMHALKISNIRPTYFKKWVNKIGIGSDKQRKFIILKLKFPRLKMTQQQAKQFYNKNIKPHTKTSFENTYRTFRTDRMKSVKVADFEFDKL